jgi:hypothetical protein
MAGLGVNIGVSLPGFCAITEPGGLGSRIQVLWKPFVIRLALRDPCQVPRTANLKTSILTTTTFLIEDLQKTVRNARWLVRAALATGTTDVESRLHKTEEVGRDYAIGQVDAPARELKGSCLGGSVPTDKTKCP